jgi:hypothetical protein
MAEYKIVNGELAQERLVGNMVDGANMLEATKLQLSKHQARKEREEAEIAKLTTVISSLETEAKKLVAPEGLTEEEKIKIVSLGIKPAKEFPGDDWLVSYEPKK